MKNNKIKIAAFFLVLFISAASTVFAQDPLLEPDTTPPADLPSVNIHLTIITDTQTLYDSDQTVSPCKSSPESETYAVSGYCAVLQSGLLSDWSWYGADGFLNSLGGVANDFSNQYTYWGWFSDLTYGATSLSGHTLASGEHLVLNYNINPLKLAVSNPAPAQHDTVILTLTQFGLDSSYNPIWTPTASGLVVINGISYAVESDGTYSLVLDSAEPYTISASLAGFIDSNTITINPTPAVANENIIIRNGDTIIYQGIFALPATGTASITDNAGLSHLVNADSVLGLLSAISTESSSNFSLSDIQYYAPGAMGPSESFYLKCITPNGQSALCQNWQYVVNGVTPAVSMDSTILSGGETIGIYFGFPHQITFDATSITAGGSFTATAQKYNYIDNTWSPLAGVTIGATQPNLDDPYNPIVVANGAVDANGSVTLTLAAAGTYSVGIAQDYYFPSYTITVNDADSDGGGGGGGGIIAPAAFSVESALDYLSGVQASDGSFGGSNLYSDWAGMALGAANAPSNMLTNIISYMSAHNTVGSLLTDNERRAMALLALGQNPYSFNGVDYIAPIINSFDGTQFGDSSLLNDDIFALIPLSSSGYTINDAVITKDILFVISKQQPDGSWDESVDLTAAAVQALKPFLSASGVPASLASASTYLENAQGNDGGWQNISSSSWAAQAMSTIGASWTKNGKTVADYLVAQQATDGAALPSSETLQNRIWATSYAIPAALKKPWSAIMQPVSKHALIPSNQGLGGYGTDIPVMPEMPLLKPGDASGDNKVDESDLGLLISQWGQTGSENSGDLNKDGVVNEFDLSILMSNWGL